MEMEDRIRELTLLFGSTGIPVIAVHKERIVFVNACAIEAFDIVDTNANSLFESVSLNSVLSDDTETPVRRIYVKGRRYDIDVSVLDGIYIMMFRAALSASELRKHSEDILASIGQELRTPFTLIFSAINHLMPYTEDQSLDKYLSVIARQSYLLLRLSNNLIDVRRFNDPEEKLKLAYTNVGDFLMGICDEIIPLIGELEISLDYQCQDEDICTMVDRQKLERIVLNLISNALKHTDKGGSVALQLSEFRDNLFISVTDTGVGVANDKMSEVFRLSTDQRDDEEDCTGYGLGLIIVKEISEMHGGSVVLSNMEDRGTKVTVSLPIKPGRPDSVHSSLETPDYAGGFSHVLLELSEVLPTRCFSAARRTKHAGGVKPTDKH